MSLWSPDQVRVLLGSARVVLTRTGRGGTTWHCNVQDATPGEATWQPAVDALASGLSAAGVAKARDVEVYLDSEFVRYRVVPWQKEFATRALRQAYVTHCFAEVYGDLARNWQVEEASVGFGRAGLAAAIDRDLLASLEAVCSPRKLRLRSAQPALISAFNANLAEFGEQPFWFVLFEHQRMTMLLVDHGAPVAVRTAPRADLTLGDLLLREWQLLGMPDEMGPVYCCEVTAGGRVSRTLGRWQAREVGPGALLRDFLSNAATRGVTLA